MMHGCELRGTMPQRGAVWMMMMAVLLALTACAARGADELNRQATRKFDHKPAKHVAQKAVKAVAIEKTMPGAKSEKSEKSEKSAKSAKTGTTDKSDSTDPVSSVPAEPGSIDPAAGRQARRTRHTPQYTQVYRADDIVQAMARQEGVSETAARSALQQQLQGGDQRVAWSGQQLVIRGSSLAHRLAAQRLDLLRQSLFDELQAEVCVASVPSSLVEQLGIRWTVKPSSWRQGPDSAADEPDSGRAPLGAKPLSWSQGVMVGAAVARVERIQPLKMHVLPPDRAQQVNQQLAAAESAEVLARPVVRLFSGRTATVQTGRQHPFVVDMNDGQPHVEVFHEGLQVDVSPIRLGDGVRLQTRLQISKLLGAEVAPIRAVEGEASGPRVQIPEVETRSIRCGADLPLGHTLVVCGLREPDAGAEQPGHRETMLLLRVTRVRPRQGLSRMSSHGQPWPATATRDLAPQNPLKPATVQLRASTIEVPEQALRQAGVDADAANAVLSDSALKRLRQAAAGGEQLVEMAVCSGQRADFALQGRLQVTPSVSIDGLQIRLAVAHRPAAEEPLTAECCREVGSGQRLVVDITPPAPAALRQLPVLGELFEGPSVRRLLVLEPRIAK